MMRFSCLMLSVVCCTIPSVASADDLQGVWFAGGTVSDKASTYAGVVYSLPGSRLGRGLAVRASANYGEYQYDSAGLTINGRYAGGEIALVYQTSRPWGWANFSVGPRVTNTKLNPIDPENARRGTRYDVGLQTDGARDWDGVRARWYGAVGPFDGTYQARLQLGPKFGGGRYEAGLEGAVIGDPSFNKESLGAYVALPVADRIQAQLGSGATFQKANKTRVYASIGLSSVF